MKNCFIFAATIHRHDKLYVLHEILQTIKQNFNDCKVFIGINYDSLPEVESIIQSYELNCIYKRLTDESLYSYGDESAYQVALNLMYNDTEKFDLCWFMHTKGGHNDRDNERRLYLNQFFTKRLEINNRFMNDQKLGSYGYRCMPHWVDINDPIIFNSEFIKDLWSTDPNKLLRYPHCPVILIETMFCMRASLIYNFIDTYPDFLYTKLRKYFFECEFCNFVPTKQGYLIDSETGITDWYSGQDLSYLVNDWLKQINYI